MVTTHSSRDAIFRAGTARHHRALLGESRGKHGSPEGLAAASFLVPVAGYCGVFLFAEYLPELRFNRTPRDGMNAVNSAGAKACFFRDEAFYRAYERPEPRSLFSHASRLSPRLRLRWSTSGFYAVINEDLKVQLLAVSRI